MKFYAVYRGRQTGVFLTWEDCKGQVLGYSNAKFRAFRTRVQAQHFVETGLLLTEKVRTLEQCLFLPMKLPVPKGAAGEVTDIGPIGKPPPVVNS